MDISGRGSMYPVTYPIHPFNLITVFQHLPAIAHI